MALDQQNSNRVDAIIIGGGPAGLAAALGLSRQMFSTVVFDSKEYRNGPTTHMHNMIGFDVSVGKILAPSCVLNPCTMDV